MIPELFKFLGKCLRYSWIFIKNIGVLLYNTCIWLFIHPKHKRLNKYKRRYIYR